MAITSIWICDLAGRILGPLTPPTLYDLVTSGRVKDVTRVSSDGNRWLSLEQVPDVSRLILTALKSRGEQSQRLKAAEIRSRVVSLRGRRVEEIFGVQRGAGLEEYRAAFFHLVKPFHPDKLPTTSLPELRDACAEMFSFLSTLMVEAEKELRARSAPESRTAVAEKAGGRSSGVAFTPNYGPAEFVGIERGPNGVQATVQVSHKNVGIFTDHSLTNISTEGVFLPTSFRLPLGSLVEVRFVFENSPRQIRARARVVWENVGASAKGSPGYGVRFVRLEKADQVFIRNFIAQGVELAARGSA